MRRWPSAAAFPPAPPRPGGPRGPRRPFAEAPAHLPLPSLGCFNPGARSSALDYAGAKRYSATPRPMTSLMLTAPGECQMEQPATASSQGEKSLRSTLEVCNDQRNWAVESGPVGVTEETLAQAFGGGFTGASWEGRYPGPVTALGARRARRARARRCPPPTPHPGLPLGRPPADTTYRRAPAASRRSRRAVHVSPGATGAPPARLRVTVPSSPAWRLAVGEGEEPGPSFGPRPKENSYPKCQQTGPVA